MNAPPLAIPLQPAHAHTHDHAHSGEHAHAHAHTSPAVPPPRRSPMTAGALGRLVIAASLSATLWLALTWALA